MIIGIILLGLIIFSFYVAKKARECSGLEIVSFILGCGFSFWLVIHLILFIGASYSFNKLAVQRDSFIQSLEYSRKNNKELESATILKDISDLNQYIASEKYDNKIWFLGQYIDDRIETLEPIK